MWPRRGLKVATSFKIFLSVRSSIQRCCCSSHAKYIPAETLAPHSKSTSPPSRSSLSGGWGWGGPTPEPGLERRRWWPQCSGLHACGFRAAGTAAQEGPGAVAPAPWPPGPVWSWRGVGGSGAVACGAVAHSHDIPSTTAPRPRQFQRENPSASAPCSGWRPAREASGAVPHGPSGSVLQRGRPPARGRCCLVGTLARWRTSADSLGSSGPSVPSSLPFCWLRQVSRPASLHPYFSIRFSPICCSSLVACFSVGRL